MKVLFLLLGITILPVLTGCDDKISAERFPVRVPALPEAWAAALEGLGPPHWRFVWNDADGLLARADTGPGYGAALSLPHEWASAVLAFPFWPEQGIMPGMLRPAGAIFPFDESGGTLRLSWEAGPTALYYRRMAAGLPEDTKRRPEYFDWPRFQALLSSGELAEELTRDPWLADWDYVAQKTLESGFDKRRIKPKKTGECRIKAADLPAAAALETWYGASPFSGPVEMAEDGSLAFPAGENLETFVSRAGMIRLNDKGWMFYPFRA
jgi:hypothetical protein